MRAAMRGVVPHRARLHRAAGIIYAALSAAALLGSTTSAAAANPAANPVFGTQEHVSVVGAGLEVTAVLDPHASTSMLYAYAISYFTGGDGNTWANFTIDNGSVIEGHTARLKAPILKDLQQHVKNGARVHRPMVDFSYCLGEKTYTTRVELIPRSGYTPPLVLGGEALREIGSIQAGRQFTVEPSCDKPTPPGAAAPAHPSGPSSGPSSGQ